MSNPKTFLLGSFVAASLMMGSDAAAGERPDAAHFHSVRLNVTDVDKTVEYYKKFFGATEILYRDKSKGLFTERSFLLMDVVKDAPKPNDGTSLWHIGWSGVDGASEFQWRTADGIEVQSPLTRPVLPGLDNKADVMYFWGPDKEIVEVSTVNRNHRFEHVHLLATDVNATTAWFESHLGLKPQHESAVEFYGVLLNVVRVDNVDIVIFARPTPDNGNQFAAKELWPEDGFRPTEGSAINHLAFSYVDAGSALTRIKNAGVSIVQELEIDPRHGHTSFYVRGPDGLLIEIVEDRPIPEGNWLKK